MLKDKIQAVLDADTGSTPVELIANVNGAINGHYGEMEKAQAAGVIADLTGAISKVEDYFGVPTSSPATPPVASTPATPAAPVDTTAPVVPPTPEPTEPTPTTSEPTAAAPVTVDTPSFSVGEPTTTGSDTTAGSTGYSAS